MNWNDKEAVKEYKKLKGREYREKSPDKHKSALKKSYRKTKEERARYAREYRKRKMQEGDPFDRRTWLKYKYGLTIEEYKNMLSRQNWACAICERKFGDMIPNVDHNHKTGKVRELLCFNCNTGLGNLKDDPKIVYKALNY